VLRTFYLPSLKTFCIFIKPFVGIESWFFQNRTGQICKTLVAIGNGQNKFEALFSHSDNSSLQNIIFL